MILLVALLNVGSYLFGAFVGYKMGQEKKN
jgi:hypothetical protein